MMNKEEKNEIAETKNKATFLFPISSKLNYTKEIEGLCERKEIDLRR